MSVMKAAEQIEKLNRDIESLESMNERQLRAFCKNNRIEFTRNNEIQIRASAKDTLLYRRDRIARLTRIAQEEHIFEKADAVVDFLNTFPVRKALESYIKTTGCDESLREFMFECVQNYKKKYEC